MKQLNLQFVLGYTGEEFAASLAHLAEGRIDVTPLITGHVGLGGVKSAFVELASPEQHAMVMVEPWSLGMHNWARSLGGGATSFQR